MANKIDAELSEKTRKLINETEELIRFLRVQAFVPKGVCDERDLTTGKGSYVYEM